VPDFKLQRSNETRLGSTGMELSRISNRFFRSRLNPGGFLPGVPVLRGGKLRLVSLSSIIHNRWPKTGTDMGHGSSRIDRVCQDILEEERTNNRSLEAKYKLGIEEFGYC
jgi:hypothetical protein